MPKTGLQRALEGHFRVKPVHRGDEVAVTALARTGLGPLTRGGSISLFVVRGPRASDIGASALWGGRRKQRRILFDTNGGRGRATSAVTTQVRICWGPLTVGLLVLLPAALFYALVTSIGPLLEMVACPKVPCVRRIGRPAALSIA
jgi:hypothetical protein